MAKDYYDILGVSREASTDDIKRAFRRLAHQHHPDKSGGDADRFKEINEAYQVLSDPQKREQYNRFGTAGGPAGGMGNMSWEDIQRQTGFDPRGSATGFGDFGDIFGDIFGFGRSRSERMPRGQDVEVELSVDFRESVFGADKTLELSGAKHCDVCGGNGAEPGTKFTTCSTCHGAGTIDRIQQTILGGIRTSSVCTSCHGTGERPEKVCRHCRGTGVVRGKRQLRISIPAGIDDGQVLRLAGQGEPGQSRSAAGDLFVKIRVRPDSMFRRDGYDLLTRRTISFSQAAIGVRLPVTTIDGEVQLEVPAGTQSGKLLRLKGKGVPHVSGRGRGDQIIEIIVKIPSKLTREQRRLIERLGELEKDVS